MPLETLQRERADGDCRTGTGPTLPEAKHWPEYAMEAACLGAFMISACVFTTLLEHPSSRVHQAIESVGLRHALSGLAMGLTAVAIICSPWGKRSGAHMNPAVTLTFYTLGKIAAIDAVWYALSQFVGGVLGVELSRAVIGPALENAAINFVVTVPGPQGVGWAFAAETAISMILMLTVLIVSNSTRLARWTPWFAGFLVATYIFLEAPISGMSMNPARTFGSAFVAQNWTDIWIYFIAPTLGMLTAALVYTQWRGAHRVFCAKFHHHNNARCIFRCNFPAIFEKGPE